MTIFKMAVIKSCCCFRSLRTGSFACAIYTVVYFSVVIVFMSMFVYDERQYLSGNVTSPQSQSFIEPEGMSPVAFILNILSLAVAVFGLLTSGLLIYGLYTDTRSCLIPWICALISMNLADLTQGLYILFTASTSGNMFSSVFATFDFFIVALNTYCILCVLSQYQEYKAGRGFALNTVPALKIFNPAQPTGTSCLSTRKAPPTYHETTVSPTAAHSTITTDDFSRSPSYHNRKPSTKKVQFGVCDDEKPLNGTCKDECPVNAQAAARTLGVLLEEPSWSTNSKSSSDGVNVDTTPLINQSSRKS